MEGLLSQEEINALFGSTDDDIEDVGSQSDLLSPEEKDAIGEISNISMGTSATTLSELVNKQKVDISTPKVSVVSWKELVDSYDKPCIFIQIYYKEGLDGNNILILKTITIFYDDNSFILYLLYIFIVILLAMLLMLIKLLMLE